MINRSIIFEVATTNYENDRKLVSSVMEELQSLCGVADGFLLSSAIEKFGWAFFKILFKGELLSGIQQKLADQLINSKGKKPEEKFTDFITKFFESRNCKVKMKLVED
jgi:hypothetical protein